MKNRLPELVLGIAVFPLLVMAWTPAPAPVLGTEAQEVLTETAWVPQSGVYVSAYFDRFDTQGGSRVLRAVKFEIENHFTFRHGIEVLDDEPLRINLMGAGASDCECDSMGDCEGGTWVKSRFEVLLGDQKIPLDACTSYLPQGVSMIRAPGPFDGVNDQAGPSGRALFTSWGCSFSTPRLTNAEVPGILEEFTWDGQGSSPSYESTHLRYSYGGVGRLDCPPAIEGGSVDASYDHWGASVVRCTYIYSVK